MVDLRTQYLRLKNEIDPAISKALNETNYIKGPEVTEFETALSHFTGSKHVIGCANGTDAIQIALMALQLPPGSEIITPSFSYAALTEMILIMGYKPVFVEVDPNTFLMDPAQIQQAITPKTKVIAPVHLYGQICNMESILSIANAHQLYVIEDNAQAIGAEYTFADGSVKQAGTMGHIGTTSFFPSKNLGCYGDGGALFTNDDGLAMRIKMIANHGQRTKYVHEVIGMNSRLDTLQAAILNVKLGHLKEFEIQRQKVAAFYDADLGSIDQFSVPQRAAWSSHVFHQYTIRLETAQLRDGLKTHLNEHNVPSMVYYPTPLHMQEAYRQNISMPLTENLCKTVLSLPIHTEMTQLQMEFITETIKKYFNK